MEEKEIIKKMSDLREKREIEILESELNDINLNSDYQKKISDHKVLNVKYLGTMEFNGEEKQIYMLIEQQKDKEGNLVQIEKYYTEDFDFLGGNNRGDGIDFITLNLEYANDEELLEKLNGLDKEGKLDLAQIEKEQLKEYAKALGFSQEEIDSFTELDLEQELEKEIREDEKQEDKEKELNEKEAERLTEGKQELNLNVRVDEKNTLGKVLDLNTGEFTKIAVVYSSRLNEIQHSQEASNSTKYAFVAVRKDGTAEVINDKLKIDAASGRDANNQAIKIDADRTARKDDKISSRYQIVGTNKYLSVENGPLGIPKVRYESKTRDNQPVGIELESSHTKRIPKDVRELNATYKGIENVNKMAKEANFKLDIDDDGKVGLADVDGDKSTITVESVQQDFVKEQLEEFAQKIWDNNEAVQETFTPEEVKDRVKRNYNEKFDVGEEISVEELNEKLNDIKDDIELDANNLNRERGH